MTTRAIPTYAAVLACFLAISAPLWAAKNPKITEGWNAFNDKRYEEAQQKAEEVLTLNPNDKDANWLAAAVYLAQKDTANSLKHWEMVVNADAAHPAAVMNCVEILLAQADTARAQQILDAAVAKKPNVAEFYYSEGLLMTARGRDADAMVKFFQAIDKDPKQPRYYVALARAYEAKKVMALAKQNLENALELDSTNAELHFELAGVLMDLKEYNDALSEYKKSRELNPDIPNVDYQIGKLYFYAEKYDLAVQEFRVALQNDKRDNFFLFTMYGQALRASGHPEEAQEYLEKAYQLRPNEISTARALVGNSYDLKRYTRVIDVLKNIIANGQSEPGDFSRIGECYFNIAGKDSVTRAYFDSAAVYLKKGYELNPDNSRLAYLLGMTYFNSDQFDSALVYFSKKVEADTTSFPAYFYLGYCYLKKEQYRDAIANLRRANRLDSTKASVHMMLAQTLMFIEDAPAAKREFLATIQLDSTQGDAYGGLGFIYLSEENWTSAARYLRRATELQPRNANFWLGFGQASYYLEKYDDAETGFRRALQYDPNNKDAKTGLDTVELVKKRKRL